MIHVGVFLWFADDITKPGKERGLNSSPEILGLA